MYTPALFSRWIFIDLLSIIVEREDGGIERTRRIFDIVNRISRNNKTTPLRKLLARLSCFFFKWKKKKKLSLFVIRTNDWPTYTVRTTKKKKECRAGGKIYASVACRAHVMSSRSAYTHLTSIISLVVSRANREWLECRCSNKCYSYRAFNFHHCIAVVDHSASNYTYTHTSKLIEPRSITQILSKTNEGSSEKLENNAESSRQHTTSTTVEHTPKRYNRARDYMYESRKWGRKRREQSYNHLPFKRGHTPPTPSYISPHTYIRTRAASTSRKIRSSHRCVRAREAWRNRNIYVACILLGARHRIIYTKGLRKNRSRTRKSVQ